jgi:hypothetical protein
LRWIIEKAARDMFMDPSSVTISTLHVAHSAASAKSFFDLDLVEAGAEDGVAPKATPNKDLVNSIRLMFIGA